MRQRIHQVLQHVESYYDVELTAVNTGSSDTGDWRSVLSEALKSELAQHARYVIIESRAALLGKIQRVSSYPGAKVQYPRLTSSTPMLIEGGDHRSTPLQASLGGRFPHELIHISLGL